MSNTIRKLRPSDYWRIGEHECWFADMAAKGLHLKKMGTYFVQFTKGEPKQMRYRIEVSAKKIPQEQIEMYEECGWNYVTRFGYFHVFSSPDELNAPELHTDPAEQSYTLRELDRKLFISAIIVIVTLVLMMSMIFSIWFLDGTQVYDLVDGLAVQQTILALVFGYTTYHSLQAAISIRRLRRDLIEGKPINHHAPWKKRHQINSAFGFIFILVIGLGAIIPYIQLIKADTKTLPEGNSDLPIVRLRDIEANPAFIRGEPDYMKDGVDWGNRYSYDWSLFAPIQYETDEEGLIPGKMWEDGSGEYSPSITTNVYQLTFPALVDRLVSDLIEKYRYDASRQDFIEKEHPDLDRLIVYEENELKIVVAAKGKAVMYVRYHGYGEVDSVISNIVEKIAKISE